MRIVYLAYDYWPNTSPQALRTSQLAAGLTEAGHEVVVLTRAIAPTWPADQAASDERIVVERFSAGWHESLMNALIRFSQRIKAGKGGGHVPPVGEVATVAGLNWKGRCKERMDRWISLRFPGASRKALPGARRRLKALLQSFRPDLVVISHEPPVGLLLRVLCDKAGIPWIAELGDPVATVYTPRRWLRKATALEKCVCEEALHVIVTSHATAKLLQQRHGVPSRKFSVISQGFSPRGYQTVTSKHHGPLRIVYTGRFYAFRNPANILQAMIGVEGVELIVVAPPSLPDIDRILSGHKHVKYQGPLSHGDALALQSSADILLNLANGDLSQIPGKLFEYLGAGRPILHVGGLAGDEQAELLERTRRGWVVEDDVKSIRQRLIKLVAAKRDGYLDQLFNLGDADVASYSWPRLGERFAEIINVACSGKNLPGCKSRETESRRGS